MKYFIGNFCFLLKIHVTSLLFLSIIRILLLVAYGLNKTLFVEFGQIFHALLLGVWFDNVVVCYVLLLPAIVLCIISSFRLDNYVVIKTIRYWSCIFFSIIFFICVANIPYFLYFFQNINSSVFQWFTYVSTTAGMIVGELSYLLYFFPFIVIVVVFSIIIFSFRSPFISPHKSNLYDKIMVDVFCMVLIFSYILGIRGRTGYNPIKVSQAYFCGDPFLNQLGIDPAFNMITSIIDDMRPDNRHLSLINDKVAMKNVDLYIKQMTENKDAFTKVIPYKNTNHTGKNVVIIFMESMSSSLLYKGFTPFLDSLCKYSTYYANAYSSGNHTNHGLFSTLYSWPSILKRNTMKGSVIPHVDGLPTILKKNGYHNMFFMTHESQYDNMNAFFRTNGFDEIFSQENYPDDMVANSFGVQDDFLLDFSIPIMNKAYFSNKPFLSVLLTISNHPPYIIPKWFKPKYSDEEKAIVEYADYSLKQFFHKVKEQPWYDNTIFVLLGDHGKIVGEVECALPDCFNHVPLIFFGENVPSRIDDSFAMQIDVSPTLLGMLGVRYTKHNMGINLFNSERQCAFYSGDKYLAARTDECLYLYDPIEKKELFYRLSDNDAVLINSPKESTMQSLKMDLYSFMQCAESFYISIKKDNSY